MIIVNYCYNIINNIINDNSCIKLPKNIYLYCGGNMKQEIIEKTYELADEIKAKSSYKRLLELKKIIDSDEGIKELVLTFQKLNIEYEEVSKYGKYHPDLKKVQKEFSEAKTVLYTNDAVKEYKALEKALQSDLDEISATLATTISKKIKHPNELGLVNKQ